MSNSLTNFYHISNEYEEDIMYGRVCNRDDNDRWVFILPSREVAGFMKMPSLIKDNTAVISEALQDYESSKTIADRIANDYEIRKKLKEIVDTAQKDDGDILIEDMEPGRLYIFFDDGGYCTRIVSCILEQKIYFMWLDRTGEEYTIASDEGNMVECWQLEYLQEKVLDAKSNNQIILHDTRMFYGMYDFAVQEIYNLAEGLVDYHKRERIPFAEFFNRLVLVTSL